MRGIFLLLAVLSAWAPERPIAHDMALSGFGQTRQVAAGENPGAQAFVQAEPLLPMFSWQERTAPRGRFPSDRPKAAWALDSDFLAIEPPPAEQENHAGHTSRLALLRAGRSSFNTTTPPPFRSV